MTRLMIGIDPGVRTGVAQWDVQAQKLVAVASMGIVEAMFMVSTGHELGWLHSVVFEDARLRTWFGAKGREALQGAGSIKRDCAVWIEWFHHVGCAYRAVSPKDKGAKLDAKQFRRLTHWEGRTNEHSRDAAMLVLGRRA